MCRRSEQYTAIEFRDAADPSKLTVLKDNLTAVVFDDLNPVVKIAGILESHGKQYSLRGESATTLGELRNGTTIVVGAFDNAWALRVDPSAALSLRERPCHDGVSDRGFRLPTLTRPGSSIACSR